MQHVIIIVAATCLRFETKRSEEMRQWEKEMQNTRSVCVCVCVCVCVWRGDYSDASSNANLSNADLIICVAINENSYLPIVKSPVICDLLNMMQLHTKASYYVQWYSNNMYNQIYCKLLYYLLNLQ